MNTTHSERIQRGQDAAPDALSAVEGQAADGAGSSSNPMRHALAEFGGRLEAVMERLLPPSGDGNRLTDAMRYAVFGGGKYLRPYIVAASAGIFDVPEKQSLRTGAAVEMIHAYSLVHDDLPAMDDDDLRRGRATCHRAFDEATAILAGDALLTLAFDTLASPDTHPSAEVRVDLVAALSNHAGVRGMVGGQMIDLESEHTAPGTDRIFEIMRLKTGALLSFSSLAGAILGQADTKARKALQAFGSDLGLAFQMKDDLLDVEGDEASLGKRVAKDAEAGKATLVHTLGVEEARREARRLSDAALAHLDRFGARAETLRSVATFVLTRDH